MSLALAALIIALASLLWNVISTVYTWKASKPDMKMSVAAKWTPEKNWLDIDVQNKGGSAVAVEQIDVFWWFGKENVILNFMRQVSVRRLGRKLSEEAMTFSRYRSRFYSRRLAYSFNRPGDGPSLPHTIQPYHSQKWSFGLWGLLRARKNDVPPGGFSTPYVILVRLSNGKRMACKVSSSYLRSWIDSHPTTLDEQKK